MNAPRGTRLHKRLGNEGRLLREITGDHMDLSINFVPKMNMDVLISGYGQGISSAPSIPPAHCYYDRVRLFLSENVPSRKKVFHFRAGYVTAFLRSVLFLGIIGRERVDYWKLLRGPSSNAHASSPLPYNSLFADFISGR